MPSATHSTTHLTVGSGQVDRRVGQIARKCRKSHWLERDFWRAPHPFQDSSLVPRARIHHTTQAHGHAASVARSGESEALLRRELRNAEDGSIKDVMVHQREGVAGPVGPSPSGDLIRLDNRAESCVGEPGMRPRAELPVAIRSAGPAAATRFVEFFVATIRNPNTREAYARAVRSFFGWAECLGIARLDQIQPLTVAAYIESTGKTHSRPTVKQHLAALTGLFDWLVVGGHLSSNPAASVRGPAHVVRRGLTPVLTAVEARSLLDSIPLKGATSIRDRALIAVMVFSFARVSAAVGMRVADYFPEGKRWKLRLREKGGKQHIVPCHHTAEAYVDQYIDAAGIAGESASPLFRTTDRRGCFTDRSMTRNDALRMVKRRARAVGLPASICCHTFRATGITSYLENGGTIEKAQAIAAHESPRTTKLYDRRNDEITLDEIERIRI